MRGKDTKEKKENVKEIHTTYDKEEEKGVTEKVRQVEDEREGV